MIFEKELLYEKISKAIFKGWFEYLNIAILMGAIYFAYKETHYWIFLAVYCLSFFVLVDRFMTTYEKIQREMIPRLHKNWLVRLLISLLALLTMLAFHALLLEVITRIGSVT